MIDINFFKRGLDVQTQRFVISGRVQGVGFRWTTVQIARRLGVTGTVQNLRSGQVAVVASGSAEQLAQFQTALQHPQASPWIDVVDLAVTDLPVHRFTDFSIII